MFNRHFSKCFALLFVLSCACAICVCAKAFQSENSAFVQGYITDDRGLSFFQSNTEEIAPSIENFNVTLNDQPISVSSVRHTTDMPVTYYCLIDISGSLNKEQLQQEKDMLKALSNSLSVNDQMVIAPFGNTITSSGYLKSLEDIHNAIDSIQIMGGEDTNLYGGIVSAIHELQTSNQSTFRKCLVVLTDGQDDQKSSYTQKEVDEAISESCIPFYGMAVMKTSQAKNNERIAYAKLLGSFARESVGGVYYNPVLDGISAASVGEAIHADMCLDLQVFLDLSDLDTSILPSGVASIPLKVRYMTDSATYGASFAVDTADLRGILKDAPAPQEPEPEPEPEPNPEPEPEPEPNPEPHFPVWGWIVVAFILIVALLILYCLNKKHKEVVISDTDDDVNGETVPEIVDYGTDLGRKNDNGISLHFPEETLDSASAHKVVFSALNYKTIRLEIELPEDRPVTLGRDQRADIILNSQDNKLSGAHCRVLLKNGHLLVWDADSTNGTTVDGVPIRDGASAALENGRTLGVGSYEYRVEIS